MTDIASSGDWTWATISMSGLPIEDLADPDAEKLARLDDDEPDRLVVGEAPRPGIGRWSAGVVALAHLRGERAVAPPEPTGATRRGA